MKKMLIGLMITGLFAAAAMSNTEKSAQNEYKKPVVIQHTGFKAAYKNGAVEISWKQYLKGDLKYYKVVKSNTNQNPVYPEDGYIFFTTKPEETSFTDTKTEPGVWYYRLCVITNSNARWISPVIKITIPKTVNKSEEAPSAADFK